MKNLLRAGAVALVFLLCAPAVAQASDPFASSSDTVAAPCRHWSTITPSDSADLARVPKAIYVGTGGDITMIGVDAPAAATGVTWKNVPASALIPARPRRIKATGTTAADILGCF